jgi:hypothetical protein
MLAMVAGNDLAEVQREFAAALLDPAAPVPSRLRLHGGKAPQKRFAVHRNNMIASLVAALAARFPVVHQLVGDEFFRAMARLYVINEPPRTPVLLLYGDRFPDFVENFAPAASIEYLADVARLELARGHAYHAADAAPIDRSVFGSLRPDELAGLRIALHPSVSLVRSQFPFVSIWEAHRKAQVTTIREWVRESALVARPGLDVEVWRLPAGGYVFLGSLSQGMAMAAAADCAAAATSEFDAAENLAVLLGANVVIALQRGSASACRQSAYGPRRGDRAKGRPVPGR